jgi:hypothetical protein
MSDYSDNTNFPNVCDGCGVRTSYTTCNGCVVKKREPRRDFHAHLDECRQCRDNPFALCLEGARLLSETATAAWQAAREAMKGRLR